MAKESTQQRLSRDKAPRVQLTYDVEIGDAIENKELPFVMGVVGDYAGQNKEIPRFKDRKFVNIDKDNFDDVMQGIAPKLAMKVDNKLADDDSRLSVNLEFKKMEDFEPQNVANQIDPLRKLLEARMRLSDLRNKMAGNEKLEELLEQVVQDTDRLKAARPEHQEAEQ